MPDEPTAEQLALARSVRDRLLNLARQQEGRVTFNALLRRYMQERLLWRLSASRHSDRFVLKGALRLVAAGFPWARATMDIDLLGYGDPSPDFLADVFRDVCRAQPSGRKRAAEDAVTFDAESVRAQHILEGTEYGGVRVFLTGNLGTAREPLHVDVGFGDAISPEPEEIELPCLLPGMPAPRLRAYNDETTIAEKFQTMVALGPANSRMKDFYDLFQFATTVPLDGARLSRAVLRTFERRGTTFSEDELVLRPEFGDDPGKQVQWTAFRRGLRAAAERVPDTFSAALAPIRELLGPVHAACATRAELACTWDPGERRWTDRHSKTEDTP